MAPARRLTVLLPVLVCVLVGATRPAVAEPQAAQAPPAPPAPTDTFYLRNWTRLEAWSFFEPPPGGGDPRYADVANRLQIGFQRSAPRYDFTAAVQYVQFGGLPAGASGPGPLGTGALYYSHSGSRSSRQVYLRYLNARWKEAAPGLTIQVGRMAYTSGAEAPSGNATIEAVKRQRVDARLVGEFEWSLYQRAYDGVRVDWARQGWRATAAALRPTQGGFEEQAGSWMKDVTVLTGAVSRRPGRPLAGTDVQVFATSYRDHRAVAARPDNSGRPASRVDVAVNSAGASIVGAYPAGAGEIDALVWLVGQGGDWYGQSHRAGAVAVEIGYRWRDVPWRPWVRGGIGLASGDGDPGDDRHGTFFQMLPTGRRYSLSATYSFMNLTDVFVQAMLRPATSLGLRIDLRHVSLSDPADRWYAGSGATQSSGSFFGYGTRPSQGATSLGTVVEGSADYTVNRRWSINGYVGFIKGGAVVQRIFANDRLVFAYLENVLQF